MVGRAADPVRSSQPGDSQCGANSALPAAEPPARQNSGACHVLRGSRRDLHHPGVVRCHRRAKREGLGYRRIAAAQGRSPSTVRRWLRRARDADHLTRLWQRGTQELIRLDAEAFNELASTGNLLRDTLTVLAAAAWRARRRLGIAEPVWTLIGLYTRGRLLAPPG